MKIHAQKIPVSITENKISSDNRLKERLLNFLSKTVRIINTDKRSKITVSNTPPQFARVFCQEYDSRTNAVKQTGFVSHYGPRKEPALFIHGLPLSDLDDNRGFVYNKAITIDGKVIEGRYRDYVLLSPKELVSALKTDFNIDLRRNGNTGSGPLHLICCYAGGVSGNSLGAKLSKEIGREVICYGNNEMVSMEGVLLSQYMKSIGESSRVKTYPEPEPLREIIHSPNGTFRLGDPVKNSYNT